MKKIFKNILIPIFFLLVFAVQSIWHAQTKSATFDEGGHLVAGYLTAKTGMNHFDISHPPLIRHIFSAPLLIINPPLLQNIPLPDLSSQKSMINYSVDSLFIYAAHFIYQNKIPAEILLFWPRTMNILLGCLLGYWIYRWSKKLYGEEAAWLSLIFFAFCPNLIAHASLVTTDLGGVCFVIGFFYALSEFLDQNNKKWVIGSGILLGCSLLSKYSNIMIIPLFILIYIIFGYKKWKISDWVKNGTLILFIAWIVLCAGYRFEKIFITHTLSADDWILLGYEKWIQIVYSFIPLPDTFLKGIFSVITHNDKGHNSFLLGHYSLTGWRYYFPVALFLKTPTVTLIGIFILFCYWMILSVRKNILRDEIILLTVAGLFFSAIVRSKMNVGIRHALLMFPIFYILLGRLIDLFFKNKEANGQYNFTRYFFHYLILTALMFEVWSVSPHYLAFFNRMAGGPEKGIHYLSDSNIDWGQDLKNLANFLKSEGSPEIVLSYFGTAVPEYYGIRYQNLPTGWSYPFSGHLNSIEPKKEYLAVSVTNLQGTYFTIHDLFGWLKQRIPIKKVGYSIYVYDITHDLESQEKLLEIYKINKKNRWVEKQSQRVENLKKMRGKVKV